MKTKSKLFERWEIILQEFKEAFPKKLRFYNDKTRNADGGDTYSLMDKYATIGRLEYLLHGKVEPFKRGLIKQAQLTIELFEQYNQGDPIDPTLCSMSRYRELLDTLASGDIVLSKKIASLMGDRKEIEDANPDFVWFLGYTLKAILSEDIKEASELVEEFKEICVHPDLNIKEFLGYPLVLEALLEKDVEKANNAFKVLIEGHIKKCKSPRGPDYGPYFHDSPDADLFVWGIGLVNLCRYKGLDVQVDHPLVPKELFIPCHV